MAKIYKMPQHLADLIAAGEVVERPASVVKELVENSIDAGASSVTVEIRGGGTELIRVTDNGCGMAPEDAENAFLRHATSKLRDERGLESIGTMGFRGEALAAVSAVSRVELTTRRRGDREGTRVLLEAGDIQEMQPCGCPEGTCMTVRDLFYNTPARLKFLKSDRSEAAACQLAALRCALGRPEVSVRFLRDGKEEFFSPGDGRAESCVYTLLGRESAAQLLACRGDGAGVTVSGYVSSPSAGRGSRREQYFFCNGRFIRSALLQSALEQAYKNTLLTGKYPACVLYLDVALSQVDVNVHPTKAEVKFSQEKALFDTVYYAVLSALQGEDRVAQIALSPATRRLAQPRKDFFQSMSAESFRIGGRAPAPARSEPRSAAEPPAPGVLRSDPVPYQLRMEEPPRPISSEKAPKPQAATGFSAPAGSRIVEKPVQNVESPVIPDHKILGEAMKTYILVERGEELILIDKHAAHERMNFDRLRAQERHLSSQTLLTPVTFRPDGEDAELLEQNAALLGELGFELEAYGAEDFVVRAVPSGLDEGQIPAALEEICEKLRRGKGPQAQDVWDELLHTVACKAAVKAGWDTGREELETLVDAVLSGRVKYCPHGRPVSAVVTRRDLDRLFKRIV